MNLAGYRVGAGIAVRDMERAREFYEGKLGLADGELSSDGGLTYPCGGNTTIHVYPSADNAGKSEATLAGWEVDDLEAMVTHLRSQGVSFEAYDLPGLRTDESGIAAFPDGKVAYFKDPDGNTLSIGATTGDGGGEAGAVRSKRSPDRYRFAVIPHIFVTGAADAIKFYEAALGATEIFRVAKPDGTIVHAEIEVGGSVIMVGDAEGIFEAPGTLGGQSVGLHVYVDDVDALFARAVASGGTAVAPVQDMFYGDRVGMVRDPYGHIWVLLTHREDVAPEEIARRGGAMFSQD